MVLADAKFTRALRKLASERHFHKLFNVTAEQHKNQKDLEYLVRIIVHTAVDYRPGMDIQEFLTSGVLQIVEDKVQNKVLDTAHWVVSTLYRILGESALLPPESNRFSLRALEGIVVGLARNRRRIETISSADEFIRSRISKFWDEPIAEELRGAGMRGTTRVQKSIPFGEKWFNPEFYD